VDAIHKITTLLTGGDNDLITMEDLDTKGMTTRKQGTGRDGRRPEPVATVGAPMKREPLGRVQLALC